MIINYDPPELYNGKEETFLVHEELAPLLDYYSQAQFSQNWLDLDFKNSDDTFAEELEETVLKNSFDEYWVLTGIQTPDVLYIKTIDATPLVEKLGYQFVISDSEPFSVTTTSKGFEILTYTTE